MKKLSVLLLSLLLVAGLSACSVSSGSISGVTEDENKYVVTFENADKDMSVSTEFVLEEDQALGFDHLLEEDDSIAVIIKDASGAVVSDDQFGGNGGGMNYLTPGTYTIEVTVLDKANGTLTLHVETLQKDDAENPWKITEDLQEGIDATGIEFHLPIDEALPGDVKYYRTFYTEDILQVNFYSESGNELFFRISNAHEGKEDLAGDYNQYAKNWEEPVKGLMVNCYGEEDSIRLATFSVGDKHYSLNYNAYGAGPGLTVDELNSLLSGM